MSKSTISTFQLFEMFPTPESAGFTANLDSEEAAVFAEFKRQQAQNAKQKPVSGDADLTFFQNTGRKFR